MKSKLGCGAIIGAVLILGTLVAVGVSFLQKGLAENRSNELIIGILLISVAVLSLIGYVVKKIGDRFSWSGFLIVLITLLISAIIIGATFFGARTQIISNRPSEEILNGLSNVCQGYGVAEAMGFESGKTEPYKLAVLKESGEYDVWSSEVNPSWQPETLQEVEVVLCLGEMQNLTDTVCDYTRYRQQREVWLVDARTGETILTRTLNCYPPNCVLVKSESTEDDCSLQFDDVEDWVNRILEPNTSIAYLQPDGRSGEFLFKYLPEEEMIIIQYFRITNFECAIDLESEVFGLKQDEKSEAIVNGQFTLNPEIQMTTLKIEVEGEFYVPGRVKIEGTFDETGEHATGTWDLTSKDGTRIFCSGSWNTR